MTEKNEFEDLDEDSTPTANTSEVPNTLVSAGSSGQVYDWSTAPTGVKAPPRIDLNGQTVIIKKAEIILPSIEKPWQKTKAGNKEYKYCTFALHYDKEGQQEFISGVRVFKREDGKYSHPTVTRDRNNQASALLGLYADFKQKEITEISLREFMGFLNSQPKIIIKTEEVKNPVTGEKIKKNIVGKFV